MVDSWTSNRPFSSRSRAASLRASSRVPACAGHGRQVPQGGAHPYEGAYHEHTHLNRTRAVEDVCRHESTVFRERIREVPPPAAASLHEPSTGLFL